jgi:hypothetical protein
MLKKSRQFRDLTGRTYGKLTVMAREIRTDTDCKQASWRCRCVCSNEKVVISYNLRKSSNPSCGCDLIERLSKASTKHGESGRAGKYRATNRYRMRASAKNRAKNRSLEFDLTLEDIIIPEYCPVLGIKLDLQASKMQNNSPSLDRVDNSRGYTADNIAVISNRANRLKCDATAEELQKVVDWMRKMETSK